ncbi:MAG: hypothetical protein M3315_01100 [Actinomycetota bacterium]|nr:hypothetical protein [Actinomycetota bacterium]
MKYLPVRGQTGNIAFVFLPDSASTVGAGKTGLTNASAGLTISVRREKSAAVTAYSGANIGTIATLGTWVNPGTGMVNFKEVDATNMPGVYELHFVDALFDTSDTSRKLVGMVQATGIAPSPFEMGLVAADLQDGVHLGLTGVPNAAAGASGGLPTLDANLEVKASTLRTNNDKTGYSLTAAYDPAKTASQAGDAMALTSGERTTLAGVIWATLTSALTTVGSVGKLIVDNLNATITSRQPSGNVTVGGYASGQDPATQVLSTPANKLATDATGRVTVGSNADKTGYALTAAYDPAKTASQAGDAMSLTSGERTTLAGVVWGVLTSALTTVGSIGKLIVDNLNATITSRQPSGNVTVGGYATGQDPATSILATPANKLATDGTGRVTVGSNADKTGYALTAGEHTAIGTDVQAGLDAQGYTSARATLLDVLNGLVQAIWDKATSAITTAGSIGRVVKDNLDATVSSRLATAGYTAPDNATTQANATILAEINGLLGKHTGIRNTVYSSGNLVSYDICLYDTAPHATTNDGVTGLVHKYSVVNTYDGSNNLTGSVTTRVS